MINVIHLGLGQIGIGTIHALLAQPRHLKLIAVVDPDLSFSGRTLRDIMGKNVPPLKILANLKDATKNAHVATMTTGSRTIDVRATVEQLIRAKVHIVSTCEELAYPQLRAPKIAAALDKLAKKHRVAIVGTGVNPGFAMDAFALTCTAPCFSVKSIHIFRSLDATKRRLQLQKKVGAGMSLTDVNKLIKKNAIGHVGLGESIAMIAAGLGWKLQKIDEKFTAIIAQDSIASDHIKVEAGQVRGLHMVAKGFVANKKLIELDLTMAFGADTYDEVRIEGTPNLTIRTTTGFPGEASTVGIVANCVRAITMTDPGIRTMLDLLRVRSVGI